MIYSVVIAVAFSCVLDLELFLLYIANLSQVKVIKMAGRKP